MTRKQKLISDLHYPLWLLKDFMWMAGLPILSLILAIPTIIISIYISMITQLLFYIPYLLGKKGNGTN